MSFQSLIFLAFLALSVPVCIVAGRHSHHAGLSALGLSCLIFYVAGGGWDAFFVLCAGILVSRIAVTHLAGTADSPARKRAFRLAVGYHIAVLLVFKYAGFFTGGVFKMDWVPLGLSFFTQGTQGRCGRASEQDRFGTVWHRKLHRHGCRRDRYLRCGRTDRMADREGPSRSGSGSSDVRLQAGLRSCTAPAVSLLHNIIILAKVRRPGCRTFPKKFRKELYT